MNKITYIYFIFNAVCNRSTLGKTFELNISKCKLKSSKSFLVCVNLFILILSLFNLLELHSVPVPYNLIKCVCWVGFLSHRETDPEGCWMIPHSRKGIKVRNRCKTAAYTVQEVPLGMKLLALLPCRSLERHTSIQVQLWRWIQRTVLWISSTHFLNFLDFINL